MKKKLISSMLAAAILLCTAPATLAADAQAVLSSENVALRVSVVSDSHILPSDTSATYFGNMLDAQKEICGKTPDVLALIGDIVYDNRTNVTAEDGIITTLYDGAMAQISSKMSGVPMIYSIGNHEYPQSYTSSADAEAIDPQYANLFETKTGLELNHHIEQNGYHFIAGGYNNRACILSAEDEEWLMTEIDKAIGEDSTNDTTEGTFADGVIPNSTKPVFLALHVPMPGTVFNTSSSTCSAEFVEFLKSRPQVVNVVGHWHVDARDPETIWQDGFTSYQAPLSNVGNLEIYTKGVNYNNGNPNISTNVGVHEGAVIDVDNNNVVKIYKFDYTTKELIGEPWEIDIPAIVADRLDADTSNDTEHMLYSDDKRTNLNAPSFPESAELAVAASGDVASVTYPNTATNEASDAQQDGFVEAYKVIIKDKETQTVFAEKLYHTDFYSSSPVASYTREFGGLAANVDYIAEVYPMSPLGAFGEPITAEFSTEAEVIPDGAVRYEFEDVYTKGHSYSDKSANLSSGYSSDGGLVAALQSEKYVSGAFQMSTANSFDPSFEFQIDLPADGSYDIEYAVSQQSSGNVSGIEILIDGVSIGTNSSTYSADKSFGGDYPWVHTPMRLYKKTAVELKSGPHTVTVNIGKCQSTLYLFALDYIQFTPPESEKIAVGSATRIEFEDYFASKDFAEASNKKLSYQYGASSCAATDIPIMVSESGYYDITFLAGNVAKAGTAYNSKIDIYIDETYIGTNDGSGTNVNADYRPGYWDNMPMYSYTKNQVWLSAGPHTIKTNIAAATSYSTYNYWMDYIEFESSDSFLKNTNGAVTGFATYSEPVTGTAILALYDDLGRLVKPAFATITNQKAVTVDMAVTEAFSSAKLFVWDLSTLYPQTAAKPLSVN